MTYSKRQKAHYNTGKSCKGNRKAKETVYSKAEIEEQLASLDPDFRYHMSKRKRNTRASLEHTINWYTQKIAEYERNKFDSSFTHYLRSGLKSAQKSLDKFNAKEKR